MSAAVEPHGGGEAPTPQQELEAARANLSRSRRNGMLWLLITLAGVAGVYLLHKTAPDIAKPLALGAACTGFVFVAQGLSRSADVKRVRRLERVVFLTEKYQNAQVARQIVNGDVWQGMTEEMLRDCMGRPADVDHSVMKSKTKEVWKYGQTGKNRFAMRITLENGAVVGWETKGF